MDRGCATALLKFAGLGLYVFGGVGVFALAFAWRAPAAAPLALLTVPLALSFGYSGLKVYALASLAARLARWATGDRAPRPTDAVGDDAMDWGPTGLGPADDADLHRSDGFERLPWGALLCFVAAQQPAFWLAAAIGAWLGEGSAALSFAALATLGLLWSAAGAVAARAGWVGMPE